MSGKQDKKTRKIARQEMLKNMERKLQTGIPIAGCPKCGHQLWYLQLDAVPPNHTRIVSFICAYPRCEQHILCDIDISEQDQKAQAKIEDESVVEALCPKCEFTLTDCQCEEITDGLVHGA